MDSDMVEVQRELMRSVEYRGARPIPGMFVQGKIVGVSFVPAYPDNLHRLRGADEARYEQGHPEPLSIVLKRNPANKYDGNAIEVHAPGLGEDAAMLGHIPRDVAARIAPEMDAGVLWRAGLVCVLVSPANPGNPGCLIGMGRAFMWEALNKPEAWEPQISYRDRDDSAFVSVDDELRHDHDGWETGRDGYGSFT